MKNAKAMTLAKSKQELIHEGLHMKVNIKRYFDENTVQLTLVFQQLVQILLKVFKHQRHEVFCVNNVIESILSGKQLSLNFSIFG